GGASVPRTGARAGQNAGASAAPVRRRSGRLRGPHRWRTALHLVTKALAAPVLHGAAAGARATRCGTRPADRPTIHETECCFAGGRGVPGRRRAMAWGGGAFARGAARHLTDRFAERGRRRG